MNARVGGLRGPSWRRLYVPWFHGSRRSLTTSSPFVSIVVLLRPIPSLLISTLHAISLCPCLYPSSVFFNFTPTAQTANTTPSRTSSHHLPLSGPSLSAVFTNPVVEMSFWIDNRDYSQTHLVFHFNFIFNRQSATRFGND